MEEEKARYKAASLSLASKLLQELRSNTDDAKMFFGDDLYKAYRTATNEAVNEVNTIRGKIRNL